MNLEQRVADYALAFSRRARSKALLNHKATKCQIEEPAEYGDFGMTIYAGVRACIWEYEYPFTDNPSPYHNPPTPLCRGCARKRRITRLYWRLCRIENRKKRALVKIGLSLTTPGGDL